MDGSRLDVIAKALVTGTSRRRALVSILGVTVGGMAGALGLSEWRAASAMGACGAPGDKCSKASHCCTGICTNEVCACPCGQSVCGGACTSLLDDPHNCGACGTVCSSGVCINGQCVASCTDGIQDGHETDVDCGGPDCMPCADGKHCLVNSDCLSHVCIGGVCAAPTCSDGVKNGLETDIDCGGPVCPKCGLGKQCLVGSDCVSGICTNGVCSLM
jgi:hypothetical protein